MTTDDVERELALPEEQTRTCLFDVPEGVVAQRMGLREEDLDYLRVKYLNPGEDFMSISGDLYYAEDGIHKIGDGIIAENMPTRATSGDLTPTRVQGKGKTEDAATVILDAVVIEIYPRNPQYLKALLGGNTVTIKVNNNANFIAQRKDDQGNITQHGTIIPSRALAMRSSVLFDFIGRCPRTRGRW